MLVWPQEQLKGPRKLNHALCFADSVHAQTHTFTVCCNIRFQFILFTRRYQLPSQYMTPFVGLDYQNRHNTSSAFASSSRFWCVAEPCSISYRSHQKYWRCSVPSRKPIYRLADLCTMAEPSDGADAKAPCSLSNFHGSISFLMRST